MIQETRSGSCRVFTMEFILKLKSFPSTRPSAICRLDAYGNEQYRVRGKKLNKKRGFSVIMMQAKEPGPQKSPNYVAGFQMMAQDDYSPAFINLTPPSCKPK